MNPEKIIIISTPVAPLGDTVTGGVTMQISSLTKSLLSLGYDVEIYAPKNSTFKLSSSDHILKSVNLIEFHGELHRSAQLINNNDDLFHSSASVLNNMLSSAFNEITTLRAKFVINISYDWLAFFLTPFFNQKLLHYISSAIDIKSTNLEIKKQYNLSPNQFAFLTSIQSKFLTESNDTNLIPIGLDLNQYSFNPVPKSSSFAWAGRISPEKDLELALKIAREINYEINIFGAVQDEDYFNHCINSYQDVKINFHGHLETNDFQRELGRSEFLLMLPNWLEAYGIVVTEALATGTPVISYLDSGPGEIIKNNQTGYLVKRSEDQISLIEEIKSYSEKINLISRSDCRRYAEENFSGDKMVDKLASWLAKNLTS